MLIKCYSDYVHEFATWTACRAVQRGFVNTKLLKEIIEKVALRGHLDDLDMTKLDVELYDRWHRVVATKLIMVGNKKIEKEGIKMTYGRAAKIIAIYIKASRTIKDPKGRIAKYAHPPVDRKLLKELRMKFRAHLVEASMKSWTKFNDKAYFETIKKLRQIQQEESMPYFWMIEKYWKA